MVKLIDVTGIGPVAAKLLSEHKIKTVETLASISLAELQKIPGFSGDIRARAVKKAAADCLQGKSASKVVKQLVVPVGNPQTTASKVVNQESIAKATVLDPSVSQVEADEGKKKEKKDGKKKEKVKDKKKKNKDKNKNKNKKKDDKKKRKEKKKS